MEFFYGASDGFIDVTITGGTGNYNYTWTADNGFTASTDDISNLSAGNYSLSVVDENDCPITRCRNNWTWSNWNCFYCINENGFEFCVMEIQMDSDVTVTGGTEFALGLWPLTMALRF